MYSYRVIKSFKDVSTQTVVTTSDILYKWSNSETISIAVNPPPDPDPETNYVEGEELNSALYTWVGTVDSLSYLELASSDVAGEPSGGGGSQGVQGPRGFQGFQGVIGEQGPEGTGAQGSIGPQGAEGPQGVQGLSGPQGVTGSQGSAGPQGVTGSQGSTGPQGFQGPEAAGGTPAMTLIASNTPLAAKGKTMDISVPLAYQTSKHLVLLVQGWVEEIDGGTGAMHISIAFNGDYTATNYNSTYFNQGTLVQGAANNNTLNYMFDSTTIGGGDGRFMMEIHIVRGITNYVYWYGTAAQWSVQGTCTGSYLNAAIANLTTIRIEDIFHTGGIGAGSYMKLYNISETA